MPIESVTKLRLHGGPCAERCPTGDEHMQKHLIEMTHAETVCRSRA